MRDGVFLAFLAQEAASARSLRRFACEWTLLGLLLFDGVGCYFPGLFPLKKVKLQVSLMSVVCLDALLQTSLCLLGWKQMLSATGYERTDHLPWCHGQATHTLE